MATSVGGVLVEEKFFAPGQALTWHRHEGSYGCVMLAGCSREEGRGETIELGVSECSWRPPLALHRVWTGNERVHALTFEVPEHLLDEMTEGGLSVADYCRGRSGTVLAFAHRLLDEIRLGCGADPLLMESLVFDLVSEATESLAQRPRCGEPAWLLRVRDRLHDELCARLSLADLAAEAGVHPIHLARSFRQRFGRPLGAYHRHLRLDRALRRVVETDAGLAEIAVGAGFADQSHFTHLVRRAVGISPGQLRALSRRS